MAMDRPGLNGMDRRAMLAGLACSGLAACSQGMPGKPDEEPLTGRAAWDGMEGLRTSIAALDPSVNVDEAARAAHVAYSETRALALAYEIEDPPLVHNAKVNAGLKPRGLCWHWAEDMEKRLRQEQFRTLDLHRAIANWRNPILIDHSTVIISAEGYAMPDGIVLDPWREGGVLFWSSVRADTRYDWTEREEVFRIKSAKGVRRRS